MARTLPAPISSDSSNFVSGDQLFRFRWQNDLALKPQSADVRGDTCVLGDDLGALRSCDQAEIRIDEKAICATALATPMIGKTPPKSGSGAKYRVIAQTRSELRILPIMLVPDVRDASAADMLLLLRPPINYGGDTDEQSDSGETTGSMDLGSRLRTGDAVPECDKRSHNDLRNAEQ